MEFGSSGMEIDIYLSSKEHVLDLVLLGRMKDAISCLYINGIQVKEVLDCIADADVMRTFVYAAMEDGLLQEELPYEK